MNTPNHPDDSTEAWESAMSRDFDARVRDLHEAPLGLDHVKGKAVTIQRNRRIAVAGGVLAVAAVVTPVAVIATDGDSDARDPGFAESSDVTDTAAPDPGTGSAEYVHSGTWVRADGTEVDVPEEEYGAAALWDGHLVATRYGTEAYPVVDVIDADGNRVESFDATSAPAINEAGTTMAWVDTDGTVMTRWADGETAIGEVDLAGGITYEAAAVTGGPDCNEEADGCVVYLNNQSEGGVETFDSHGVDDSPVTGMNKVFDATEAGLVSVTETVTDDLQACGGIVDLQSGDFRWDGCDYQTEQIAPGGDYVIGTPSEDGLGVSTIVARDAVDGDELGRYSPEGGHISTWAWVDGSHLVFTVYDGADWQLLRMVAATGEFEFLVEGAKGPDFRSPFLLVQK